MSSIVSWLPTWFQTVLDDVNHGRSNAVLNLTLV